MSNPDPKLISRSTALQGRSDNLSAETPTTGMTSYSGSKGAHIGIACWKDLEESGQILQTVRGLLEGLMHKAISERRENKSTGKFSELLASSICGRTMSGGTGESEPEFN